MPSLTPEQEIERIGNEWGLLFAAGPLTAACEYETQPLCERIACVRIGGIKIRNCTRPTSAFRNSFFGALVQEVEIKGHRAAARFSNGALVEFWGDGGTWLIDKVGGKHRPPVLRVVPYTPLGLRGGRCRRAVIGSEAGTLTGRSIFGRFPASKRFDGRSRLSGRPALVGGLSFVQAAVRLHAAAARAGGRKGNGTPERAGCSRVPQRFRSRSSTRPTPAAGADAVRQRLLRCSTASTGCSTTSPMTARLAAGDRRPSLGGCGVAALPQLPGPSPGRPPACGFRFRSQRRGGLARPGPAWRPAPRRRSCGRGR